jgi:hypothetical protein
MARIVLHTENAVGSFDSVPNSIPTESSMATALLVRGLSPRQSFVYSGFDLSDPNTGLVVSVAAGTACIEGYVIQNTATATVSSLPDSTSTVYIWASLSRDGNGLVDDFDLTYTTVSTWQDEFVLLGKCTTAGGQVTATTSAVKTPNIDDGTYTGDGSASRVIWLGMTPRFVRISRGVDAVQTESPPVADNANWSRNSYPLITTYGFEIGYSVVGTLNENGHVFYYTAFF